jgi:hypothetical protein
VTDHAWLEKINHNIQMLLAKSELRGRKVEVRGQPDLSLEIAVDGEAYQSVYDIADEAVHDLVRAAIDEWQDEAEAAAVAQAASPPQHATPSKNRTRLVGWLVVMILVFVVPPLFITPVGMATWFSLMCAGAMSGGLVGVFIGRAIARRVAGGGNLRAWMLGGWLGGALGMPMGFFLTVQILPAIP